jgi:pyruvate dehydrogenase E1 component
MGTDGFGRSDTREALRSFFEVDRFHIVLSALTSLVKQGLLSPEVCSQAIQKYGIDKAPHAPWEC